MKKITLLFLLLQWIILAGCTPQASQRQPLVNPSGNPPTAWIDAPLDGMQIPLAPYEFVAHATAEMGIGQFEWTLNDAILSTQPAASNDKLQTFRYLWSPLEGGAYTLKVRGQTMDGVWSEYDIVHFSVGVPTATITPTTENTATPTLVPSTTSTITTTPTPTAIATNTPTPTTIPQELTFSPSLSSSLFYFGSCSPNSVQVSVLLSDTANVKHVELYLRLLDQDSSGSTNWDSYSVMNAQGDGNYRTTVKSSQVPGAGKFNKATVLYQFIVIGKDGKVLTRSDSYNDLGLNNCLVFIAPDIDLLPLVPSKTPIIIK